MIRSHGILVVALGGNAISPEGGSGDITEQFEQTRRSAERLADLVVAGFHIVITHGNGPQVGSVLRRVEIASPEVYGLPLDICVADTQGGMGYMIAQCLDNALSRRGISKRAIPVVTTVLVDRGDPAFEKPTKPIGPFYSPERAEALRKERGYRLAEIPGHGFRRVVASPRPREIVEIHLIRRFVYQGELIIAAGGGGIPVYRDPDRGYVGLEAVVDKDLTSALLAYTIGAEALVIVTGVPRVAIDFEKPTQRFVERMTRGEAEKHASQGQFPTGSMGPKIDAAVDFLRNSDRPGTRVVICDLEHLLDAVEGRAGTWIVNE